MDKKKPSHRLGYKKLYAMITLLHHPQNGLMT